MRDADDKCHLLLPYDIGRVMVVGAESVLVSVYLCLSKDEDEPTEKVGIFANTIRGRLQVQVLVKVIEMKRKSTVGVHRQLDTRFPDKMLSLTHTQ